MERCIICKNECEDYGKHVREKHPISCQEVIDSIASQAELDDETSERTVCHLAACRLCKDTLKANSKDIVGEYQSRKALAEMNAHSRRLL